MTFLSRGTNKDLVHTPLVCVCGTIQYHFAGSFIFPSMGVSQSILLLSGVVVPPFYAPPLSQIASSFRVSICRACELRCQWKSVRGCVAPDRGINCIYRMMIVPISTYVGPLVDLPARIFFSFFEINIQLRTTTESTMLVIVSPKSIRPAARPSGTPTPPFMLLGWCARFAYARYPMAAPPPLFRSTPDETRHRLCRPWLGLQMQPNVSVEMETRRAGATVMHTYITHRFLSHTPHHTSEYVTT